MQMNYGPEVVSFEGGITVNSSFEGLSFNFAGLNMSSLILFKGKMPVSSKPLCILETGIAYHTMTIKVAK